jgi:hypothetical protein
MKNSSGVWAVLVLVILMGGCNVQKNDQSIMLMPNQGKMQCNIVMNIEGERNVFALTVPETIGNREKMLLNFPETNLVWEGPGDDGVVTTGWTNDSVISYSLELIPGKDFIDAAMNITNLSEDKWEDVWSFNCLNPVKATTFQDLEMDRTYMSTKEGPKRLSDTKRIIGHRPSIGVYYSEKMELDEQWAFISWFEATSLDRTDGDYLVTLSESGKTYMAATSPNTLYLFNNLDFTCIHAAPTFGNIGPGESSSLTTRFYFSEGGLKDFLKRFNKDSKLD